VGSNFKNFVSFYYTNVPKQILHFHLRQGFEVCGILEDVYLTKKHKVNSHVYGFVRFCNIRYVGKLSKALNNVWYDNSRVFAKVVRFDRFEYPKEG